MKSTKRNCVLVARHLHDDRSTVLTMAAIERIEEKMNRMRRKNNV